MARICFSCLSVRGSVINRTNAVNIMIATPNWLKQMV